MNRLRVSASPRLKAAGEILFELGWLLLCAGLMWLVWISTS